MPELPLSPRMADTPSAGGGGDNSPCEELEHSRNGNICVIYHTKIHSFLET
jgi:hypothetical protein